MFYIHPEEQTVAKLGDAIHITQRRLYTTAYVDGEYSNVIINLEDVLYIRYSHTLKP